MTSQLNLTGMLTQLEYLPRPSFKSTNYGITDGLVAWDTVSTAEWVAVALGSVACMLILASCAFIFYHRSYTPWKASQWPLLVVLGIAGVTYWCGSLASLRIFPNTGPFLVYCGLFSFWMTWFALFMVIQVIVYRVFRLYWLLILKFQHTNFMYYGGFLCFALFPLVCMSVGSALYKDGPTTNSEGYPTCHMNRTIQIAIYVWASLVALCMLFLAFALRNCTKKAFQEYKTNMVMAGTFSVFFVVEVIFFEMNLQENVWGRVIMIYLVLASVLFAFFYYTGPNIYHCIKDPEEFEKQFWRNMDADLDHFKNPNFLNNSAGPAVHSKDSTSEKKDEFGFELTANPVKYLSTNEIEEV